MTSSSKNEITILCQAMFYVYHRTAELRVPVDALQVCMFMDLQGAGGVGGQRSGGYGLQGLYREGLTWTGGW